MTKSHGGNLSADVTTDALRLLFTDKGFLVIAARVICEREGVMAAPMAAATGQW